ncbi:hydroxymethylglutaryl-CoA reductase, degradative [Enterococcus sp. AD013-P3]|uniref:hydroxymethylglutaryl-CoA reductase, degradative n=1 Tax=Enterococcus sp. AD013-P3 TaxID=3411036 RepID=UPI003B951406
MKEVVILDGLRTPIGKYKGQLKDFTAVQLGTKVTQALLNKYPQVKEDIHQVYFGNVLQAGNGQNPARQISLAAGLDYSVPAATINEVCGSGMKAVLLARQAILLGETEVVLAGGIESMTRAPQLQVFDAASGEYDTPISSMIIDGLTDAQSEKHMGLTAENVAEKYHISRKEQDAFAVHSQNKAAAARAAGLFEPEIVPISLAEGTMTADEGIRPGSTVEKLATLKTAFKKEGTVTAGNASTINDGAAALLVASKDYADQKGLPYLAVIKEVSEVGIDPAVMGIAPITAIRKLLEKAELTIADIDLFEINEAFAASSIVVERELEIPAEKINIYGGGISLGHAIGATGARILTTLGHQLQAQHKRYGVASLCIGGGLGLAVLLEAVPKKASNQKKKRQRFYELTTAERLADLETRGIIDTQLKEELEKTTLAADIADHLIENRISEVEIPMGVVPDLIVNGKKYTVPVATEEPSVIAAMSNGSKMAGEITTFAPERLARGQIVFSQVADQDKVAAFVTAAKKQLFALAENAYPSIYARGGGLREIQVRKIGDDFVSVDFLADTKDAMGANIINTILEACATFLREALPEENVLLSILSNLTTEALVTAVCRIPVGKLSRNEDGLETAKRIAAASRLAQLDPYRAATHNKGIMNCIEGILLATGNDTRAQAAACHAFAVKDGQYRGLSQWRVEEDQLVGELTLPLSVGIVGGGTRVLPKAQAALQLMAVTTAAELASVIVAGGLVQNLAALRALVSEGIQKGHMALQARSLALSVGAKEEEVQAVSRLLKREPVMNEAAAKRLLATLRNN